VDSAKWYSDKQWWAAIVAAPVVWSALLVFSPPHTTYPLPGLMTILMLVLVRPILEEIVFRGLFQGWLLRFIRAQTALHGFSCANLATSLLFASLHLYAHPPFMAALVLIPSLVFGYFRDRFNGQLAAPIILHCFYNGGYYLIYPPA